MFQAKPPAHQVGMRGADVFQSMDLLSKSLWFAPGLGPASRECHSARCRPWHTVYRQPCTDRCRGRPLPTTHPSQGPPPPLPLTRANAQSFAHHLILSDGPITRRREEDQQAGSCASWAS